MFSLFLVSQRKAFFWLPQMKETKKKRPTPFLHCFRRLALGLGLVLLLERRVGGALEARDPQVWRPGCWPSFVALPDLEGGGGGSQVVDFLSLRIIAIAGSAGLVIFIISSSHHHRFYIFTFDH